MLSVKDLSEYVNLPYTTTVKYLKALHEHGFITSKREGKRILYPDDTKYILHQFVELIRNGTSFSQALERFKHGDVPLGDPVLEEIHRLRKEIQELRKENKQLSDLLQVYLSRINKLEEKFNALPNPKGSSLWSKIKSFFSRSK